MHPSPLPLRVRVKNHLALHGATSIPELADALRISSSQAGSELRALEALGQAEHHYDAYTLRHAEAYRHEQRSEWEAAVVHYLSGRKETPHQIAFALNFPLSFTRELCESLSAHGRVRTYEIGYLPLYSIPSHIDHK